MTQLQNVQNRIIGILEQTDYKKKMTKLLYDNITKKSPTELDSINNEITKCIKQLYLTKEKSKFKAYYINTINAGGSFYFINDIKSIISDKYDVEIVNNIKFVHKVNRNDIIIINHLIRLQDKIEDIIRQKNKIGCRLFIFIHDFYWLNYQLPESGYEFHTVYTKENKRINNNVYDLFKYATRVILPTKFMYDHYNKYFSTHNFVLHNWIDYKINHEKISVFGIQNDTINIGIFNAPCAIKGSVYINWLKNNLKEYKQYKIKFYILGENVQPYKNTQEDFNNLVKKLNIHLILLLNTFGESWCYYLTKCLNSGITLFYNNIGSFKERIWKKENHFICFDDESSTNLDASKAKLICDKIIAPLEYIIKNEEKNISKFCNTPPKENHNEMYNIIMNNHYYFNKKISGEEYEKLHKKIRPYAIYFPQYHAMKENDHNFYKNYTDAVSLKKLKIIDDDYNLCTPNFEYLNIKSLDDYDLLKNKHIITKQIELAKQYGYLGFCVYYYFFSNNQIANDNVVMKKVIDIFFDINANNFNIFFDWANENWNDKLSNNYSEKSINDNINILLFYFKHDKYLKIDNKPVILIHNPSYMKESDLIKITTIFEEECIKSGFSGINIVPNGLCANNKYKNYQTFYHTPFHHKVKHLGGDLMKSKTNENEMTLDFFDNFNKLKHYNDKSDDIKVVWFSFNNKARKLNGLMKGKHCEYWTTYNNNYLNEKDALEYLIKYYNNDDRNELQRIFLVNSWNEWGEQMAIEPSNENGFYYLELIDNTLKSFFS